MLILCLGLLLAQEVLLLRHLLIEHAAAPSELILHLHLRLVRHSFDSHYVGHLDNHLVLLPHLRVEPFVLILGIHLEGGATAPCHLELASKLVLITRGATWLVH